MFELTYGQDCLQKDGVHLSAGGRRTLEKFIQTWRLPANKPQFFTFRDFKTPTASKATQTNTTAMQTNTTARAKPSVQDRPRANALMPQRVAKRACEEHKQGTKKYPRLTQPITGVVYSDYFLVTSSVE